MQDADGAQDLQLSAGRVEFDGVCFSYAPGCVDVDAFTFTHSHPKVGTRTLECTVCKAGKPDTYIVVVSVVNDVVVRPAFNSTHTQFRLQGLFVLLSAALNFPDFDRACLCLCSTEVLRDVTFTVEAGKTVALVCCSMFSV